MVILKVNIKNKRIISVIVDPFNITNTNRTNDEKEAFLLFCVCVAGKKATMISEKLANFLSLDSSVSSPFQKVRNMIAENSLTENLKKVKMGKYSLIENAFTIIVNSSLNLNTVTPEELETVPGVGKKTSRFFILHSRENANVAVIDTHILKYLNSIGVDAGKSVPTGKRYDELEQIMLSESKKMNMSPADFDFKIWSWYASKKTGHPIFK